MNGRLLLGSNNKKKRGELAAILEGLECKIVTPADMADELGDFEEPVEDGDTFEANARIKALYYSELTGLPTLADDSGLVVDALGGAPGVYSARYAGEEATDLDNCLKLLDELESIPDEKRTARFKCTIVVVDKGKVVGTSTGACEGTILREMSGKGGFGYDPLFLYAPENRTFAELDAEVKNSISHRGNALNGIRPVLEKLFQPSG